MLPLVDLGGLIGDGNGAALCVIERRHDLGL